MSNVEVGRLSWVDDMVAGLGKDEARLLANYTMKFGGRLLPYNPDSSATLELSPNLIDALSRQCPCRKEHALAVSSYYESIDETVVDAARGVQTKTTQYVQTGFMRLVTEIDSQQNSDDQIKELREKIFDQLGEDQRDTSNILNCLLDLLKNREGLGEFTNFLFTRTIFAILEELDDRLRQAALAGEKGAEAIDRSGDEEY
ncbi:hypothetical protein BJX63DRAFT_437373 [Aspergillus granulosus]|uniref:Uncharacterized protein n=1 Tax=Aspergillus granulosus TaxID=176169 RepID=A0ABR4GV58_9EURO